MATVVEAVAVSCGRADKVKSALAQVLEEEMAKTIQAAYEDGLVNDPDAIKERMEATRRRVKEEFAAR